MPLVPRTPANDGVTVEAVHAINQRIFETSLDLILVTDRKGTFVRVSPSSMAILGYDPAEMVGHSAAEFLYGEDLENTRNEMRLTRRNLTMRNFDCRYVHKAGRIVTLWWSGVWSATEQQYFFIGRDVTERKEAERRLRESAHLLEAAMDVAQLGSWVSEVTPGDQSDGRLEWSRRSHLIFGTAEHSFDRKASTFWNLVHPDDRPLVRAARLRAIETDEPYEIDHRIIRTDGAVRWVRQRASVQRDATGSPLRVLGVIQDITERRASELRLQELQAELAHAWRLTEMGQMASGLAHELNQPLNAASNYLGALLVLIDRTDGVSLERAKEAAGKAVSQVLRAGEIIRRLREFIKKSAPDRKAEGLVSMIEEAGALALVGGRDRGTVVHYRLASNLPPVLVDKVQIQQVLVNLLRNATEAMETSARREIAIEASCNAEPFVTIAVIDTGPGIAEDVAERLFQPFVTTKGQGMGVGLSLCRAIIEAHGGRLWAEPNPRGGAIFRLTLPAAPA